MLASLYFSRMGITVSRKYETEEWHVRKPTPMGAGVRVISVMFRTERAACNSFSRAASWGELGVKS